MAEHCRLKFIAGKQWKTGIERLEEGARGRLPINVHYPETSGDFIITTATHLGFLALGAWEMSMNTTGISVGQITRFC